MKATEFQDIVWSYYRQHGRHDLPWRQPLASGQFDPYRILVSELMLQQTQVPRVIPKFQEFLELFPTCSDVAVAPLEAVLRAWNGLGYNRRAKFLWQTAGVVVHNHNSTLPDTLAALVALPGVGPNTAGAILAYAYNKPIVFVETNIRTVFIHHFFAGQDQVDDRAIADMVAQTLPDNAREWYWALMDYGTFLKQTVGNLSNRSKHYNKQSAFLGSRRQIRGQILRELLAGPRTPQQCAERIADERLPSVLEALVQEGLIQKTHTHYKLANT